MIKIFGIFRIIIHYAKSTTWFKAVLFSFLILPVLFILLIKAIQLFIPFTYIAF